MLETKLFEQNHAYKDPNIFSIICENLAVISMWGGDWYDFYIVEKDNTESEDSETQKLVEII